MRACRFLAEKEPMSCYKDSWRIHRVILRYACSLLPPLFSTDTPGFLSFQRYARVRDKRVAVQGRGASFACWISCTPRGARHDMHELTNTRTQQLESTSEEDIEAFLASRNIASNMTVRTEAVLSPYFEVWRCLSKNPLLTHDGVR